jgi:MFS transporter, FHS family, L-fucose permease
MSEKTGADSISRDKVNISIVILGMMFFVFGFVSWLNSILIPYFKIACELNNFQSYFVTFAFYISYFFLSVPSAYLLKRTGFKKGISFGFVVMAAGAFLFIPAALYRMYPIFLLGLFTIGTGLALLQTAANPFITLLGPKESAARRISIMGILNKGAGILAPMIFAALILRSTDTELFRQIPTMNEAEKDKALDELIRRVIWPYFVAGLTLLGLAAAIWFSPLPEINTDQDEGVSAENYSAKKSIFQFPHLVLGALAIFLHVGTQVIAIDTVINYATSMQLTLLEAKSFPSYTLALTILGYLLGITLIPRVVSQRTVLRICTLLGIVFTLLIVYSKGEVYLLRHPTDISIWFVVALGFANSMVWAGIWPLALDGLGKFTKLGASLMIMGLSGNAILPQVYGYFADAYSLREAYWVLLPCYLYLAFYAFVGHQFRRWGS